MVFYVLMFAVLIFIANHACKLQLLFLPWKWFPAVCADCVRKCPGDSLLLSVRVFARPRSVELWHGDVGAGAPGSDGRARVPGPARAAQQQGPHLCPLAHARIPSLHRGKFFAPAWLVLSSLPPQFSCARFVPVSTAAYPSFCASACPAQLHLTAVVAVFWVTWSILLLKQGSVTADSDKDVPGSSDVLVAINKTFFETVFGLLAERTIACILILVR